MTIYVDDPMTFIKGKFKGYCHMWTDGTHNELNEFALKLGLKLKWAQEKRGNVVKDFYHFDISPLMRANALRRGAQYLPLSEYIKRVKQENGQ